MGNIANFSISQNGGEKGRGGGGGNLLKKKKKNPILYKI
jgi:hypothetical protein